MPLDPKAKLLLDSMAGAPPMHTVPLADLRLAGEASISILGEPEPVERVEDRDIPGPAGDVPVRIYWPANAGPLPILVVLHGGGWVMGSIGQFDNYSRTLTNSVECIVISVGYHLAPESKFPVPLEDCYAVTVWAAEQGAELGGDPERLAILGDSAGGNLAAALALLARDRNFPKLVYQVLVNPALDYPVPGSKSMQELGEGFGVSRESLIMGLDLYLSSEADRQNPYAFPLRAADLSGLPPAMVLTAEYDPLRDEGEAYAERLKEAGIPVVVRRYGGVLHGWVVMAALMDQGKEALQYIATGLREVFGQNITTTQPPDKASTLKQ